MIRGTTPTHTFTFNNLDPSTFKVLNIYYSRDEISDYYEMADILYEVISRQFSQKGGKI